MAEIALKVNGESHTVDAEPESQLLYILRNQLQFNGPKFGCGLMQCGACTVMVDGTPVRACLTPVSVVGDKEVTTLDGLGVDGKPGPVQQAFIDEQAAQCGYCINGMVMMATALLKQNPNPTDEEIRAGLAANLCRCGTHLRIIKAIKRAASGGTATPEASPAASVQEGVTA